MAISTMVCQFFLLKREGRGNSAMVCLVIVYFYRYGKPVVLDMMDVDMFDTATMKFDEVKKGLMASLMSKDLLKNNK